MTTMEQRQQWTEDNLAAQDKRAEAQRVTGLELSAESILWHGYCLAAKHGAPMEMQTRLAGAHAYCEKTGKVLRDETRTLRREAQDTLKEDENE